MTGLKRLMNSSAAIVALFAAGAVSAMRANGSISGMVYAVVITALAVALILKTGAEDFADKFGAHFHVETHARQMAFFAQVAEKLPETVSQAFGEAASTRGSDEQHAAHMRDLDERLQQLRELRDLANGEPKKEEKPS